MPPRCLAPLLLALGALCATGPVAAAPVTFTFQGAVTSSSLGADGLPLVPTGTPVKGSWHWDTAQRPYDSYLSSTEPSYGEYAIAAPRTFALRVGGHRLTSTRMDTLVVDGPPGWSDQLTETVTPLAIDGVRYPRGYCSLTLSSTFAQDPLSGIGLPSLLDVTGFSDEHDGSCVQDWRDGSRGSFTFSIDSIQSTPAAGAAY